MRHGAAPSLLAIALVFAFAVDLVQGQQQQQGDGGAAAATAVLPPAKPPPVARRPAVLLFGDSLTEYSFDQGGWGALLAHHYARKVDVINRGFTGYNSKWGLEVLPDVLRSLPGTSLALATLLWGANDAAIPDRFGGSFQAVPLSEFKDNLRGMVRALRAAGVPRVIILSTGPVDEATRIRNLKLGLGLTGTVEADRTLEASGRYAAAAGEVASEMGVPFVDLWKGLQAREHWQQQYLRDGLHFTPEGQAAVWALLLPTLGGLDPPLRSEAMPFHLPDWDQFGADPMATLRALVRAHPPANMTRVLCARLKRRGSQCLVPTADVEAGATAGGEREG